MENALESVTTAVSSVNETFTERTETLFNWLKTFLTWENLFKAIGSVIMIFIIWFIYRMILRTVRKSQSANPHREMLFSKIIKYSFYIVIVMYVLSLFGIKFSAIWGAAGIAGVAIGFAAQTSVSNLISGLFVLTEGTFHVGDTIIVDGITGVVDAVNLLSVRIHTTDNQMVRIPNSTIIDSNLMNNSFYDKRRVTATVGVAYESDLGKTIEVCKAAALSVPTVLQDPEVAAWIIGFSASSVDITVAAWAKTSDFLNTKTDLHIAILRELGKAGIEVPYSKMEVSLMNVNQNA